MISLMSKQVINKSINKNALPRTGRVLDAIGGNINSMSGGSSIGGSSFSGYWDLITTNAAGEALDEGKEYIRTKYSAVSEKDVVAYGTQDEFPDMAFPIATYSTPGAVQIKQGGGLIIGEDGIISVDPNFAGGGLDEKQLKEYLDRYHYLTPSSLLYGYLSNSISPIITASDSVNSAFKKLETQIINLNKDYVTLTTDQTIIGQKTFEKTVLSKADVVAYAVSDIGDLIAIATPDMYGLVKYDSSVFSINPIGQLTLADGAGVVPYIGTWIETNIEHQDIQYAKYSIRPSVKRYEQEMDRKLFFEDELGRYETKFNLNGLMRGDMTSRSNFYHNAVLDGWLSRNEVREMENMNRMDGLDDMLYPGNENIVGKEVLPNEKVSK